MPTFLLRHVPQHTDKTISHPRGLLLTLSLMISLKIAETLLSYATGIGLTITSVKELLISNGLSVLLFSALLSAVKNVGRVEVGSHFFGRFPKAGDIWVGDLWESSSVYRHLCMLVTCPLSLAMKAM